MKRTWAIAALPILAGAIGFLVWWGWLFPPKPAQVSGVGMDAIEAALALDPQLPLSAAETDVVLVVVCTLRSNRLEPYGYSYPTSPFLDALSNHGVQFNQHYSQTSWTRPSMGSLLTGRYPRGLQLDSPEDGGVTRLALDDEDILLGEVFSDAGRQVIGAVNNPNVREQFGFAQGFDVYHAPTTSWTKRKIKLDDNTLVSQVLNAVDETPDDQRIYIRMTPVGPHTTRQLTRRDRTLLQDADHPEYDAAVRLLDARLARLFVAIKERRPNTLFVVVADHGEGLSQPRHHHFGHGNYLFQTTIHTPWLIHHPSLTPQQVNGLTMNIDVMPTILDMLGMTAPAIVDGRSQAAVVRGETSHTGHTYAFSETMYNRSNKGTIISDEFQLIRNRKNDRERIFARSDWRAREELSDDHPTEKSTLSTALDAWEAIQSASVTDAPVEAEADEETSEMLRAMGYVE